MTSTLSVDRVRVRMLPGPTVEDYAAVGDRLAQTFRAQAARVRSVPRRPHHVELWPLTGGRRRTVSIDPSTVRALQAHRARQAEE